MGAILTKVTIGATLFMFMMAFAVLFMINMGGEYGVTPDYYLETLSNKQFNVSANQIMYTSFNSTQLLQKDGIDSQTVDAAQLGAGFNANNNQLSVWGILSGSLAVMANIFNVDPFLIDILIKGILGALALSVGLALVFRMWI
jgi:hypothetical protein